MITAAWAKILGVVCQSRQRDHTTEWLQVKTHEWESKYKHSDRWATIYAPPIANATSNKLSLLRCVNTREEEFDSDGVLKGVGGPLVFPVSELSDFARYRQPQAFAAGHIPIGCENPISMFFLCVADRVSGMLALASSLLVWTFVTLFIRWLAAGRGEGLLYNGPLTEWAIVLIVLVLQVAPIVFESIKPFKELPILWAFTAKVQSSLHGRMRATLIFLSLDLLQPFALIGLSIYIALYLSEGSLLTALLNVAVLSFIASLDTVLLKQFLELRYSPSHRIYISLLDVHYIMPNTCYDAAADFWNQSNTTRVDAQRTLRSEDASLEKKWNVLVSGDRGFGVLGKWAASSDAVGQPQVAAVVLDVSAFSWSDLPDWKLELLERDSRLGWFLAAASEFQWTYEMSTFCRAALLYLYPDLVERFSFSGDLRLGHWELTEVHLRVLVRMMEHSPELQWMSLEGNQFGDAGVKIIADALPKTPSLAGLNLRNVGMTDVGAEYLLGVLAANPQALSNCVQIGENGVSDAMIRKMQEQIGSADMFDNLHRGVLT